MINNTSYIVTVTTIFIFLSTNNLLKVRKSPPRDQRRSQARRTAPRQARATPRMHQTVRQNIWIEYEYSYVFRTAIDIFIFQASKLSVIYNYQHLISIFKKFKVHQKRRGRMAARRRMTALLRKIEVDAKKYFSK